MLKKKQAMAIAAGMWLCCSITSAVADGSETGRVKDIILESSELISVWLDGPDYTAECSGGGRWTLTRSDPLFKEKYAAILSAANAGQSVTLVYKTWQGCGAFNGNSIYYVHVTY